MARGKKEFYLVDFKVLPEAIKKTIRAKEMLKNGEAATVNEAALALDMSRSAYYKYKDHVAPASAGLNEEAAALFIVLRDDPAVIGRLLRRLAAEEVEILLMEKGLSIKKQISMTLTLRWVNGQSEAPALAETLRGIKGIKQVCVAGEV